MNDNSVYVSLNGSSRIAQAMQIISNNLANANTTGFRADKPTFDTLIANEMDKTAVNNALTKVSSDFSSGNIINTGNDLDIAIDGQGMIATTSANGREAYTRAGSLHVTQDGLLLTKQGNQVMGNGGPIAIPEAEKIAIAKDGTISIKPKGAEEEAMVVVDRIKLVNPNTATLGKGPDGLFYIAEGAAVQDDNVQLITGAIESSNVNVMNEMVEMMTLTRQFETGIKLVQQAEQNETAAQKLLSVTE